MRLRQKAALTATFSLCCLFGGACRGGAATLQEEVVSGIDNVVLVDVTGRHDLTGFRSPTTVHDFALSPDERYAFVWHESHPPRTLSVYRTKTRELMARFAPGFGGALFWTGANTIMHYWGFSVMVAVRKGGVRSL